MPDEDPEQSVTAAEAADEHHKLQVAQQAAHTLDVHRGLRTTASWSEKFIKKKTGIDVGDGPQDDMQGNIFVAEGDVKIGTTEKEETEIVPPKPVTPVAGVPPWLPWAIGAGLLAWALSGDDSGGPRADADTKYDLEIVGED